MKKFYLLFIIPVLLIYFASCKKTTVAVVDFSKYTVTDNECRVSSIDTTDWNNEVIWSLQDSNLVAFTDTFSFFDTLTGKVSFSPACPNPSNGLFICNITPEQQCKLKVVCVNSKFDLIYFNTYLLYAEPITLGFDFREATAFHKNNNYRMYYAFYTSRDSMYYRGHGDFRIQ
ncbi:MAG: hypothetical protein JWO06_1118 [Bacteroidota bacterium]|nr:hypothetical protein [Bacteroidota bacterium]